MNIKNILLGTLALTMGLSGCTWKEAKVLKEHYNPYTGDYALSILYEQKEYEVGILDPYQMGTPIPVLKEVIEPGSTIEFMTVPGSGDGLDVGRIYTHRIRIKE